MRKSIDGLSLLVVGHLERNPTDGAIYVFVNKYRNKIKILYYDRNGFALWYKRLERGKFKLPIFNGKIYSLGSCQLNWLLDGLEFMKLRGHKEVKYTHFC
jgi:transposase